MENKTKIIATKLTETAYNKFYLLAELAGLSAYELIQLIIDTYLKFYDRYTDISLEMGNMLLSFQDFKQEENPFYISKNTQRTKPREVKKIVFVQEYKNENLQPVLICEDKKGMKETYNINEILKFLFGNICPRFLRKIDQAQKAIGTSSIIETLQIAIKKQIPDYDMEKEIEEMFSDNARHDFGKKIDFGTKYINRRNKNIETLFREIAKNITIQTDPNKEIQGLNFEELSNYENTDTTN